MIGGGGGSGQRRVGGWSRKIDATTNRIEKKDMLSCLPLKYNLKREKTGGKSLKQGGGGKKKKEEVGETGNIIRAFEKWCF